jgi:hypothetical protein
LNSADSTAFAASFRARGIATAMIRYKYKAKVYQGVPNPTFKFKGARIYDPRLDSTNGGAGTHRYDDETTWEWSDNAALCLAWYLIKTNIGGEYDPATEIDWTLVAAAANVCDDLVDIPTASTQARYTCNGILLASDDFVQNVSRFVDCMLGRIIFRDGKWRMYAGSWTTPSHTINKEDWLEGGLSVQFIAPRGSGRWNGVRTFYTDKTRQYQRVESYPRTNAGYTVDDGDERIWLEIEQPLCDDEYEAQRKGEFLLRQSRNQIKLVGRLPPRFQNIATWDTCYLNFAEFGWADKTFRVVQYDLQEDGSITVALCEEQSTDWTDLEEAEYNAPSTANLAETGYKPDEPSAFTLRGVPDAVQVFVGQPDNYLPGVYYNLYEHTAPTPITSATLVGTFAQSRYDHPRTATDSRFYWVQAAYSPSQLSTYVPTSVGLLGRPLYVSSGFRIELNDSTIMKVASGTPITTGAMIATPINGTAPFSTVFSKISGDAIAINSAVSSRTTFTGSGMAADEIRAMSVQVRSDDAAGASYIVNGSVLIRRQDYDIPP